MHSFWEKQVVASNDFVVIGAGIMGLSLAYELRQRFPKYKITVIERSIFPGGASTKNAGFACFGSPTEILSDSKLNGQDKAVEVVQQRMEGLKILKQRLGEEKMGYTPFGGYELLFDQSLSVERIATLNEWLQPVFKEPVFSDVTSDQRQFGFSNVVKQLIRCKQEAQVDSGKLMQNYWKLLQENNIQILSGANVIALHENEIEVESISNEKFSVKANRIFICTNAFVKELFPEIPVKPGRGQVVLTTPVTNLSFKGSFHFDEGFYYFRNIGDRVLLGGGRNTDFATEETTALEPNPFILKDLTHKLKDIILPNTSFEIEQSWQGIMGFAPNKLPQIMDVNKCTTYVMACNGMGVALSPFIAQRAVNAL